MSKRLTATEKQKIINAKAAGYSERSIAAIVGRSRDAVRNVLRDNPVSVEAMSLDALQAVAETFKEEAELLASIAARQRRQLTELFSEVREATEEASLEPDPYQASMLARKAASLSTALTNLYKVHQQQYPERAEVSGEFPELVVKIMDDEDVAEMRRQQEEEAALLGY